MRRKDKEIRDPAAVRDVLDRAAVLRLALADGGEPYLVPVLFAREPSPEGERLYFHSAREGRKMEVLARNPRVCFEAEGEVRVVPGKRPCMWSLFYRSVIGYGKIARVEDPAEKKHALDLLVRRYGAMAEKRSAAEGGGPLPEGPLEYGEAALRATVVLRIDVEELTGKASGK